MTLDPASRARAARRPAALLLRGRTALLPSALLALAAALLLVGCGGSAGGQTSPSASIDASGRASYTDISPSELATMLRTKDFVLANAHVPYEGEIERTDLFLPFDQAAALVDRLPPDKSAPIVVYCRTGHMSRIAAGVWAEAGYTNLYNLDGGFAAWEAAGYPLLHDRQ